VTEKNASCQNDSTDALEVLWRSWQPAIVDKVRALAIHARDERLCEPEVADELVRTLESQQALVDTGLVELVQEKTDTGRGA